MVFSQPPFDRDLLRADRRWDRNQIVPRRWVSLESARQEQNGNNQQHRTGDARGWLPPLWFSFLN